MNQNFELYKVFYHVVKEGQISKAAKKMFISQPAVSQSIKLLEENLGGKLFLRTPKGVVLTTEGKVLYEYVEKAYGYFMSGEKRFKELKDLEGGEIRIGASDTLCSHYLLSYLEEFHEKYPKIKIHVFNKTTYEIIDLLKKGEVDLGFINLPIQSDPILEISKVEILEDCFICGEKYKKNLNKVHSLKELSEYPLVLLEEGTNMRKFIDQLFLKEAVEYEPEFELGSIDLLVKFAKVGFGISFVTKNFVQKELSTSEVFIIDTEIEIPKRAIGMIKIKNRPLSNASDIFYKIIQKA